MYLVAGLLCLSIGLQAACDRSVKSAEGSDGQISNDVILSPTEVAQKLGELHRSSQYEEMAKLIAPEGRQSTVDVIRAVDDVLSANAFLKKTAETQYRGPVVEARNLEPMANNLGLFSRDVTILSQRFVGETAYVTLQEGENVPLIHAEFVFQDGRWLYRPEKTPVGVARELVNLANILWDISSRINGEMSVNRFAQVFDMRVMPQIHRVMWTTNVTVLPTMAKGSEY